MKSKPVTPYARQCAVIAFQARRFNRSAARVVLKIGRQAREDATIVAGVLSSAGIIGDAGECEATLLRIFGEQGMREQTKAPEAFKARLTPEQRAALESSEQRLAAAIMALQTQREQG